MRDKALTVLKNLLDGGEIRHPDGNTYLFSDENELCVKGTKYRGGELKQFLNGDKNVGEDVLLKVNFGDFSLKDFITWARNIPDNDVTIMAANVVLNQIHHRGGRI